MKEDISALSKIWLLNKLFKHTVLEEHESRLKRNAEQSQIPCDEKKKEQIQNSPTVDGRK